MSGSILESIETLEEFPNIDVFTPDERLNFLRNAWKEDEEFVEYYNKLEPAAKKRFMSRLYNYFSTDFWSDAA